MIKFTKLQNEEKSIKPEEFLYDGYIKVKSNDGWEYVVENDCVVAMVHLLDYNEILLRKEIVPPFRERYPSQEFFLTIISGTMEKGEAPIDTIKRELVEEAGILLNTQYSNYQSWGDYFFSKGNTAKCHIFYIPLRVDDFQKVSATGDGTEFEKNSNTVRIDLKYLNALKPADLITCLCIEKMKSVI